MAYSSTTPSKHSAGVCLLSKRARALDALSGIWETMTVVGAGSNTGLATPRHLLVITTQDRIHA